MHRSRVLEISGLSHQPLLLSPSLLPDNLLLLQENEKKKSYAIRVLSSPQEIVEDILYP